MYCHMGTHFILTVHPGQAHVTDKVTCIQKLLTCTRAQSQRRPSQNPSPGRLDPEPVLQPLDQAAVLRVSGSPTHLPPVPHPTEGSLPCPPPRCEDSPLSHPGALSWAHTCVCTVLSIQQLRGETFTYVPISRQPTKLFATLWTVARQASLCPWDSPGKNTAVGSILAWRISWTQEPGSYSP